MVVKTTCSRIVPTTTHIAATRTVARPAPSHRCAVVKTHACRTIVCQFCDEFHRSVVKLNPQFQYALSVALIINVGQHLYWEIMMSHVTRFGTLGLLALLALSIQGKARADDGPSIKTVFVIAMENNNWTQPTNQFPGPIQQIFQNPAAPFINSLVNGTAANISRQVAYATNYRNVLATASGNNPHIHPSEPNYIWAEAGTNFG